MHKLITCSLLSIGLLFSAHAQGAIGKAGPPIGNIPTGDQPLWLTTESPRFPRIDYFSRRSDGANPEQADEQAKDKIFQLLNPTGDVPADAIAPLADLQILDRWHDTASNTYWSYAGLPQQSAADYLREQVQQLDDRTEAAVQLSQKAGDLLQQIGAAYRAHTLQQRRAVFQDALKTVDLTGRGTEPRWTLESLDETLQSLVSRATVSPSSDSDSPHGDTLKRVLTAAFKAANLTQSDNGDYVIHTSLTVAEERQQNNWILARGTLKLGLLDSSNLDLRGEKEWQIDIMGLTANAAIRRVLEKAEFLLKKEMRSTIIAFGAAIPEPEPAPVAAAETSAVVESSATIESSTAPVDKPAAKPSTPARATKTVDEGPAATAIPLEQGGPITAEPL